MNKKHTSNLEAMAALRSLGFAPRDSSNSSNEQSWTDIHGEVKKYKFQKRSGERGKDGRYLIGVAFEFLESIDAYVFWADIERFILVIPSSFLKELFEAYEFDRKVAGRQWHTNVTFDRNGKQYFAPVFCEGDRDISKYAFRLPG